MAVVAWAAEGTVAVAEEDLAVVVVDLAEAVAVAALVAMECSECMLHMTDYHTPNERPSAEPSGKVGCKRPLANPHRACQSATTCTCRHRE